LKLLQESQKALSEAMKPAQQFQNVLKELQESQKALREAVAPSQKYLDAIQKANRIAGISGEDDEV